MWKSEKQIQNELNEQLSKFKIAERNKLKWQNVININYLFLNKLWFSLFKKKLK